MTAPPPMLSRLLDWYRKLSWFALLGFLLMFGNVECGIPPDRHPWKPKPPAWRQRLRYLTFFCLGAPGAAWGVVRAVQNKQKTPWGDWD